MEQFPGEHEQPSLQDLRAIRKEIYESTSQPAKRIEAYAHLGAFIEQATSVDALKESQRILNNYPPQNKDIFETKIRNRIKDLESENPDLNLDA